MKAERARSAGAWPFVWTMLAVIAAIVVVPYGLRQRERHLREQALAMPADCPSKGRPLTDQELIDGAISYQLKTDASSYRTAESFRAAYPRCCFLVRWGGPTGENSIKTNTFLAQSPAQRLRGPYTVLVGMYYRGVESDGTATNVDREYIVDACGEVLSGAPGGGVL